METYNTEHTTALSDLTTPKHQLTYKNGPQTQSLDQDFSQRGYIQTMQVLSHFEEH